MYPDQKRLYLKLYNTESRAQNKIVAHKGPIKMYTCGPTVYDFAHIGNFRTYVFEDLMRRTLKFFGFEVYQVMNITDVDDKTIKGAIKEGKSLLDYTQKYTDAFFEDLETLNIEPAEHYPKATDHIPEMIAMIDKMLKNDVAYRGKDGSIYFAISKFPSYGRLSHFTLDDLKENASLQNDRDEYDKENISDFVLWKAYDKDRDGNIYWDSPFGKGRPGWHIECSAMAIKHLGETIDIHAGGVDNIFPHHENEIAQSECCTQKCFAKHWVHSEHLMVNGRKMSKSAGNFYTLRNLLDLGYSGIEVRMALLQTHYRVQLNFTLEGLKGASQALKRIDDFVERLTRPILGKEDHALRIKIAREEFAEALSDDLNISEALASLFNLIRDLNTAIDAGDLSQKGADNALVLLKEINQVLGVITFRKEEVIPQELEDAFQKRQAARSAKDYKMADYYRDFITSKGYVIEDAPTGSFIRKLKT
jgi:cysteinyl-tRNA synthetase